MFTHINDSGGISMKFSVPNILDFRQSDWEAVKRYSSLFKRDGSVITSKWKRKVDGVNICIDTGNWRHMAFISFTSSYYEYATPGNITYGSCLTIDQLQDAKWLAFKEVTSMDPSIQIIDVDFSQIASSNNNNNSSSSSSSISYI